MTNKSRFGIPGITPFRGIFVCGNIQSRRSVKIQQTDEGWGEEVITTALHKN
jgi:hypothetical protein